MTKSTITREQVIALIAEHSYDSALVDALEHLLATMDSDPVEMPLDYLQGHKDSLEWAAQLAEANHPETGDWLYDEPIELAKAIRKGPDMPPAQPAADSEPDRNPVLAYADSYRDMAKQGVESVPIWSVITELERNIAPLYRHAQPAPVVQCPFPCGWDNLNKLAIQDAALVARGLVEGELTTEAHRQAAISNNDRLLKVISACRAAMLQSFGNSEQLNSPVIPDGWTCNDKANAALMMLDRIETVDPVDDDRIDGIKRIVRELAAAPHDTPALNSVQSVDSVADRWIPVSERMPPSRHEVLVGRWWGETPRWCCKWATYIPGHPDSQSSGWLIPGASWTPTHWMLLPAAPQEVKP